MYISSWVISDLEEAIVASGLPMVIEYIEENFDDECVELINQTMCEKTEENPHYKRAKKLATNPLGSGHDNFLSGINVSTNITATVKWWQQFQRYHFVQIISSMSTMHRLKKMLEVGTICFNDKTSETMIESFKSLINNPDITDEELAYSCPMGLELTARITTNYLQLKTIYNQRKNHKLQEWRDFCDWVKTLPYAEEFITGETK